MCVKTGANPRRAVTTYETVPEHDESHAGPYGVEMPPDWEFVVVQISNVTAVAVVEKKVPNVTALTVVKENGGRDGLERGHEEGK